MKGRQASGRRPESDRRAQKPSTLHERWELTESDQSEQDNASALRERLTRLSEASLRINESLDLDAVLQGVLDSARSLTDASYALITTIGQSGQVEDFLVSGLSDEESMRLWRCRMGRGSSSTSAQSPDRSGWRTSRRMPPRWASPSSDLPCRSTPSSQPPYAIGGERGQHPCCEERARPGVQRRG